MVSEHVRIGINDIEIYEDNPRFVKSGNQIEAIKRLVLDEKDRHSLSNLAESLLLHGQNPLESVGVIRGEREGSYIAVEGNRRTLAMKLYFNPELGEANPSTVKSFKVLHRKYDETSFRMPEELDCYVFDSIEEASPWITLKHTGQNNGAGTVAWNRIQALRQAIKDGKAVPDRGFLLVDWLDSTGHLADVGIESYEDIKNTTTLLRLLSDSVVLSRICLSFDKDSPVSSSNEILTVRFIGRFIHDLNSGVLPVSEVYTAEDRTRYIDGIMEDFSKATETMDSSYQTARSEIHNISVEEPSNNEHKFGSVDFPSQKDENTNTIIPHATPSSPNLSTRNKIILKHNDITGVIGKASQVKKEIRKIKCEEYPVASALLIRCFYELTTKAFIKVYGISIEKAKKSNLGELFHVCRERIISNGTDEQKANVNKFVIHEKSNKHIVDQLEELNRIIHDTDVMRDKVFFFTTWDTFRPFIQDLWDLINVKS